LGLLGLFDLKGASNLAMILGLLGLASFSFVGSAGFSSVAVGYERMSHKGVLKIYKGEVTLSSVVVGAVSSWAVSSAAGAAGSSAAGSAAAGSASAAAGASASAGVA
jgi:hypothetical protein